MDEQPIRVTENPQEMAKLSTQEQTQLILAQLMEGGQEDDETCKALNSLTKLLDDQAAATSNANGKGPVTEVIDSECVDTVLGYLDMRQSATVRAHATLTTSAYLKAAGEDGSKSLKQFFFDRIQRGTYDDYIVAFCVAASVFPIVPDVTTEIFLTEGFVPTLGPLMRRTWKSKKVETACLEMLNAASMRPACRDVIRKYCMEWLDEIVDQDPNELPNAIHSAEPGVQVTVGSIAMRRHSQAVQNLAAVILAKMRVGTLKLPSTAPPSIDNLDWR